MQAPLSSPVPFHKRTYSGAGAAVRDFLFVARNGRRLRQARRQGLVTPSFQERLMIAVTAVNGCRYCSYYHAREALKTGLSRVEIGQLLSGSVSKCPENEMIALLYAQHWAESDARPDAEALARLQQTYGEETSAAIHIVLRMIRMGNLLGNSWDYLAFRFSRGRFGGVAAAKVPGV